MKEFIDLSKNKLLSCDYEQLTEKSYKYVFIDGYIKKYLLPSSDHIYIGKGFKTLQFYKSPDTDGDTIYNQGLEKIDLSHLDTRTNKYCKRKSKCCSV